jgi:hypothetical protein
MFIKIKLRHNKIKSRNKLMIATLIVSEDGQRTSLRNVFLFLFSFDFVTTRKTHFLLAF